MKTIIVTGTPCTGKTTVAKNIAKLLKFKYIDVNKIIKSNNLSTYYDKKRKTNVVDTNMLNKVLSNIIEKSSKGLVIDSHLSHYLSNKLVDLCIVTKCNLKILQKRLRTRKYNESKIRENLEVEIFDICLNEAIENKHNIIIIDTSQKVNYKEIINKIH